MKRFIFLILICILFVSACDVGESPIIKTASPVKMITFSFWGSIFFDKNANGIQDIGEPPIPNIEIKVDDQSVITNYEGKFLYDEIFEGSHTITIVSNKYRYVSFSLADVQNIDRPIIVTVDGNTETNFGLLQGFLTLPIQCGVENAETKYVDLDQRLGFVLRWDGVNDGPSLPDQHPGIDYFGEKDSPILAVAPGVVIAVADSNDPFQTIRIIHDLGNEKFVTDYGHNNTIRVHVGQKVNRGDVIATMGNSGVNLVHLHFELWPLPLSSEDSNAAVINYVFNPELWPWVETTTGKQPSGLDPYRNISDNKSIGYWSVDNDPQCFSNIK